MRSLLLQLLLLEKLLMTKESDNRLTGSTLRKDAGNRKDALTGTRTPNRLKTLMIRITLIQVQTSHGMPRRRCEGRRGGSVSGMERVSAAVLAALDGRGEGPNTVCV
jgi:hypothetical protein